MKNRLISLLVFFLLNAIFVVGTVFAQEEQPPAPQYVVQSGDTLSKIATQFGISIPDLINANNISNPDYVNVGTVLNLPGIDWVDGLLDVRDVPLGESFRSILRRYDLDANTLSRLGGIVSPSQLYVGYPLLLMINGDEDLNSGRALVGKQKSVLEIAAETGINPWSIAAENQLNDPYLAVTGDVLLLPGINDPGPGSLPSPLQFEVLGGNFVQGKTTVLVISAGGTSIQLSGNLLGQPLTFFDNGDGSYITLQGIHVMAPTSIHPINIRGKMDDGSLFEYSQLVAVKSGGYPKESLTVEASLLDPAVNEAEMKYITAIASPVTPNKMWSGVFQYPVQAGSQIKSSFGIRRSFNGSPYDYFHSGVDFGWEAGVDILAPTNGIVVFVGHLVIRGNTTIIDHGWGIYTLYAHQEKVLVSVGDTVKPGQLIGNIGNTGRSSGPHLHWELWVGGVQVEPLDWLYDVYP